MKIRFLCAPLALLAFLGAGQTQTTDDQTRHLSIKAYVDPSQESHPPFYNRNNIRLGDTGRFMILNGRRKDNIQTLYVESDHPSIIRIDDPHGGRFTALGTGLAKISIKVIVPIPTADGGRNYFDFDVSESINVNSPDSLHYFLDGAQYTPPKEGVLEKTLVQGTISKLAVRAFNDPKRGQDSQTPDPVPVFPSVPVDVESDSADVLFSLDGKDYERKVTIPPNSYVLLKSLGVAKATLRATVGSRSETMVLDYGASKLEVKPSSVDLTKGEAQVKVSETLPASSLDRLPIKFAAPAGVSVELTGDPQANPATYIVKASNPVDGNITFTCDGGGAASAKAHAEPNYESVKIDLDRNSMLQGETVVAPLEYLMSDKTDVTKLVMDSPTLSVVRIGGDRAPEDVLEAVISKAQEDKLKAKGQALPLTKPNDPSNFVKFVSSGPAKFGALQIDKLPEGTYRIQIWKGSNIVAEAVMNVVLPVETFLEVIQSSTAQDLYGAQILKQFYVTRLTIRNNNSQAYDPALRKGITVLPSSMQVLVQLSNPVIDVSADYQTAASLMWMPGYSYSMMQDSDIARRDHSRGARLLDLVNQATQALFALNTLADQSHWFRQDWNVVRGSTGLKVLTAFDVFRQGAADKVSKEADLEKANLGKVFTAGSQLIPSGTSDERILFIPKEDIRGYLPYPISESISGNDAQKGKKTNFKKPAIPPVFVVKIFPRIVRISYVVSDDAVKTTTSQPPPATPPSTGDGGS